MYVTYLVTASVDAVRAYAVIASFTHSYLPFIVVNFPSESEENEASVLPSAEGVVLYM